MSFNFDKMHSEIQEIDGSHENQDLIDYINKINIDEQIKQTIINLIIENSYPNYEYIYNICVENDIELPPLL